MGQPIVVVEKSTTEPNSRSFELNRALTGMDHERYRSIGDANGDRPPDVMARRLFESGDVSAVHVYSNQVNVTLIPGHAGDGLAKLIEELYIHYQPGVKPTAV